MSPLGSPGWVLAAAVASDAVIPGHSATLLSGLALGSLLLFGLFESQRGTFDLVGWIGAGAVVFGVLGWVVAEFLLADVPTTGGLIAGLAAGGGFGAVIRLFAFPPETEDSESVTVDMEEETTPTPQPQDLFSANPDPILFYSSAGDDPLVRTVNEAFIEHFDGDLENQPLDAILPIPDADSVLSAVGDGAMLDAEFSLDDERTYRIRVVPVGNGERGYILFTEQHST